MKNRSFVNFCKNAVGAMFLLVAAFLVCSTFLSMRAVFADPVAPVIQAVPVDAPVGSAPRSNPRSNLRSTSGARPVASRGVVARGQSSQNNNGRNVVARTTNRTTANRTRNVRARTATTTDTSAARISLSGDAIRGSKSTTSTYTYLSNKLYTGNYSTIVDSSTGLISADAYSTCLESYYTCMDEICTARNEAQRRCACAGRVKSFAEAETALESANEELIKISGQLALLIANNGKEVSAAFELTDAERVMNCASWREVSHMNSRGTVGVKETKCDEDEMTTWCQSHGEYTNCSCSTAPTYCTDESVYGFDVKNLDGAGSDILASLASWADEVKTNTDTMLNTNSDSTYEAMVRWTNAINGLSGSAVSFVEDKTRDTLSETWGYDLFGYAHNNVCARVLDSCFNGIYEGCGTPPSGGRCANGATSSCPYNYNSKITISSAGDVTLNERSNASTNASASCFGYTTTSGDPYASLRGPVADARRSIMQKYLLDANADCDLYGEQLKAAAQKISYQKVAAQQALQQKRLEFYNNERSEILSNAIAAGTNFNECVSELWDCYQTQESSNPSWSTARIKTYCAQIANVPHCYQDMICNPSAAQFRAIIDVADNTQCKWHSSDYTQNTCRNVVTLNEILNSAASAPATSIPANDGTANSAALREMCLQDALGCGSDSGTDCIRNWTKSK